MKGNYLTAKVRASMYIAGILWLGAAVKGYVSAVNSYYEPSIEAILMERDYEGEMDTEEFGKLASEAFAKEKAESVQNLSSEGIYSAYGYSPELPEYVVSEGKRINLNLVASYDEEKNRTKVILASPLYNEDY